MTGLRGLFIQRDGSNNGTSPKGARLALGGLLGRATGGVVRPGALVDSMDPIVTGSGTMSYNVRAAVFATKFSDANGPVVSPNDAIVAVATTAAPGVNKRIDSVYVIQDLISADGGSTTTNELRFGVVQGSTSATPSAPAVPAGALRLADIEVTALATATSGLTFTTPPDLWTVANGGALPAAKGSREYLLWNGTEFLRIYASTAPTNHQVSAVTSPAGLWSSALYVTQEATAFGMQMTIRGRLSRTAGSFPLGDAWLEVADVSLPTALKPNLGGTDVNVVGLVNGHRPIAFSINTTTNKLSLRSTLSSFTFGATDFIDIPGQSWTRTG